jgi:hypothetical protein
MPRKKRPTGRAASPKSSRKGEKAKSTPSKSRSSVCVACETRISKGAKALYVEEDVGRVFCSEKCILSFFQPVISKLENQYLNLVAAAGQAELSAENRERFIDLRWKTLGEPDEIWRVMTSDTPDGKIQGVYSLIKEFEFTGGHSEGKARRNPSGASA